MTTTKKKRVSKKTKSSWRKNIDINDVEEFLDEQRKEEREGKLSEKPDDELFICDSTPTVNNQPSISRKQQRKLKAFKKPNNLKRLKNTSKVSCPFVSDLNVVKKVTEKDAKKQTKKIDKIAKNRKNILKNSRNSSKICTEDIWEVDETKLQPKEFQSEWMSRPLALHHLQGTGKTKVKVHESAHHRTTRAKNFQPPHPGLSYNPRYQDHQDLINKVVEKEIKIIKENEHLDRVTTRMFSKISRAEQDLQFNNPEYQNFVVDKPEDESIEVKQEKLEEDEDVKPIIKKISNEKKSKKARKNQEKVKQFEKQQLLKKERKKQITDLHRLRNIMQDVKQTEAEMNEIIKRRKKLKEKKKFEPKRLSKRKYEEPEVDLALPEEMPENLRSLNTSSSKLIVDKFKDFQRRNLLPVSVDVGSRKRHKTKRFVRKSHREDEPTPIKKK